MKAAVRCLSAAALFAVLLTAGCGKGRPGYHIAMVNRTPRDLWGVDVYFDGRMAAEKGYLPAGGLASYGFVFQPVPQEAEVHWIDESKNPSAKPQIAKNPEAVARLRQWVEKGQHNSPKVKLTGIVPNDPAHMNIYFIIEQNGSVTVKCVPSDDLEANINATKGIEKLRDKPK